MSSPDHAPETDAEASARAVESFDLRDAMIAGLASGVNDLTQVARDLYKASVLTRVQKVVVAVVLTGTMVTSGLSLILVVRLNGIASTNRANNVATRENTAVIKDCTDPDGSCFAEAQARTAALVAQLNSATLIAVECADAHNGDEAISACVTRRLKEHP